jgi:Domain of unknown function (DUF4157)
MSGSMLVIQRMTDCKGPGDRPAPRSSQSVQRARSAAPRSRDVHRGIGNRSAMGSALDSSRSPAPAANHAGPPIPPFLRSSMSSGHIAREGAHEVNAIQQAPVLRRCGGEPCTECDHNQEPPHRSVVNAAPGLAPSEVHDVVGSPGSPLDAGVRAFMEPRFGHDFSAVRVHTDARAAASAGAVGARAYTVGSHIAFAAGAYSPATSAGQRLLSHELTHTIQQRGASGPGLAPELEVGQVNDPAEREADLIADQVMKTPTATRSDNGFGPVPSSSSARIESVAGTSRHVARQPAGAAPVPAAPHPDSCDMANCTGTKPATVGDDLTRATGYVTQAVTALAKDPLDTRTVRALDWYFGSHSRETADTVRTRLGCILTALSDTQASNRWACHPNDPHLAYVRVDTTSLCKDAQAPVCLSGPYFGVSDRMRAHVLVHECAHRVGMSLGRPASVPDIYRSTEDFLNISTADALLNSDSYALFVGAVAEGIPVTVRVGIGVSSGVAVPAHGEAMWQARLYFGAELQHPVLGIFNPTLGIGLGLIGATTSAEAGPKSVTAPSLSVLVSLLPGFRLTNPRPGPAGSGYAQFFGGPAVAVGDTTGVGAEAGVAVGYRWRWLDFSAGVGYAYDPTRAAGMQHLTIPNVGITGFLPSYFGE